MRKPPPPPTTVNVARGMSPPFFFQDLFFSNLDFGLKKHASPPLIPSSLIYLFRPSTHSLRTTVKIRSFLNLLTFSQNAIHFLERRFHRSSWTLFFGLIFILADAHLTAPFLLHTDPRPDLRYSQFHWFFFFFEIVVRVVHLQVHPCFLITNGGHAAGLRISENYDSAYHISYHAVFKGHDI